MKTDLKNHLKSLILCFGMVIFIASCTTNEDTPFPSPEIREFEAAFSLAQYNDAFIKENLSIEWDNFNSQHDQENNRTVYEFNTALKGRNTLENEKNTLVFTYKLLAFQEDDGNPVFELIKFLSNEANALDTISYFDPSGFSGTLYHYNLKGENTKIEAWKDGVLLNEFSDTEKGVITTRSKAPAYGNDGYYVLVFTDHYTDMYWSFNGGGYFYAYSKYTGTTSEWVWVSTNAAYIAPENNYHHHFDNPFGPTLGYNNHPEEIIIDPSFENSDKVNCTYKQLLKNTTLNELLTGFFGEDAEFDVIFKVEENLICENADDPSGCTKATYSYADKKVVIAIDKDYINNPETPTLFIARTLIHEAIHANLFLAVKKLNGGVAPANSDFGILYEQYRQTQEWQHEFMADRYIDLIANALEEVHPLLGDEEFINTINNNYPDWSWNQMYDNLSWVGLQYTTKGEEYLQSNTNTFNLYYTTTKVNSTIIPECE